MTLHLRATERYAVHHTVCPVCGQRRGFATKRIAEAMQRELREEDAPIEGCNCLDRCECGERVDD